MVRKTWPKPREPLGGIDVGVVTDADRPELDGRERPLLDEVEPPSLVGVGSGAVDMVD